MICIALVQTLFPRLSVVQYKEQAWRTFVKCSQKPRDNTAMKSYFTNEQALLVVPKNFRKTMESEVVARCKTVKNTGIEKLMRNVN